jgi:GNAT superfamily N-acetyltransferase
MVPRTSAAIRVVPANQVPWEDLDKVLGKLRCHGGLCYCQRLKIRATEWASVTDEERAHRLRAQADCGHPESGTTTGLVAYLEDEPAGWCAVEPRTAYPGLRGTSTVWAGRTEDKDDDGVWAVTCFAVRTEYRWQGLTYALAAVAVDYARQHGARAVEGYAMITEPGQVITWGELHVGSRGAFAAAGFREVSRPSKRRAVMRIDL